MFNVYKALVYGKGHKYPLHNDNHLSDGVTITGRILTTAHLSQDPGMEQWSMEGLVYREQENEVRRKV